MLPSKLLGILATGRPVVASSPGGSDLFVLADQAGACVQPGDAGAFAASIRELVESPGQPAGRLARLLAEDRFGMAVLSRFEQQLNDLVSPDMSSRVCELMLRSWCFVRCISGLSVCPPVLHFLSAL